MAIVFTDFGRGGFLPFKICVILRGLGMPAPLSTYIFKHIYLNKSTDLVEIFLVYSCADNYCMSKLYVIGDSYGAREIGYTNIDTAGPTPDYQFGEDVYWPKQLADQLGVDKLVNGSSIGTSQDFAWSFLHRWLDEITPDDYLIVILTEASRFWFLQQWPQSSRYDIAQQFTHLHGRAEVEAINLFTRHIQRPVIDLMKVENRLAWLAYQTYKNNWRKPIVVYAMEQGLDFVRPYPDLKFSKGNLSQVSIEEAGPISQKEYNAILNLMDPRYNHLCMSNHKILVDKLYQCIVNDRELDLTSGFIQNILTHQSVADPEFQQRELSTGAIRWRSLGQKEIRLKKFKFA